LVRLQNSIVVGQIYYHYGLIQHVVGFGTFP